MQWGRSVLMEMPLLSEPKIKRLTCYQRETLVKRFEDKPYLEQEEKPQLARSLNISETKLAQWFLNKRKIARKKGLLCKYKYLQ